MMKGSHGQLHEINWGAFNHASHAHVTTMLCVHDIVSIHVCMCVCMTLYVKIYTHIVSSGDEAMNLHACACVCADDVKCTMYVHL